MIASKQRLLQSLSQTSPPIPEPSPGILSYAEIFLSGFYKHQCIAFVIFRHPLYAVASLGIWYNWPRETFGGEKFIDQDWAEGVMFTGSYTRHNNSMDWGMAGEVSYTPPPPLPNHWRLMNEQQEHEASPWTIDLIWNYISIQCTAAHRHNHISLHPATLPCYFCTDRMAKLSMMW